MGLNFAGVVGVGRAIFKPSLLVPNLIIRDIRQLDWTKLRSKGANLAIFDKDNCITKPLHDHLPSQLHPSWDALLSEFGRSNVLIVSNSAGTRSDPCLIQAETVSRNLNVPVLIHSVKKPACIETVSRYVTCKLDKLMTSKDYLSNLVVSASTQSWLSDNSVDRQKFSFSVNPSQPFQPTILIIGDRLTTDIILANRLEQLTNWKVCSVLTTQLWEREGLGTRFMRSMEWTSYLCIMKYRRWKHLRLIRKTRSFSNNQNLAQDFPEPSEFFPFPTLSSSSSLSLFSSALDERAQAQWKDCVIPHDIAYPPLPPTKFQIFYQTLFRWTEWFSKKILIFSYHFLRWALKHFRLISIRTYRRILSYPRGESSTPPVPIDKK